jgi:hypothetical protein
MNVNMLRALCYDAHYTDADLIKLCEFEDGILARAVTELCTCAGGSISAPTFRIGGIDIHDGDHNAVILCNDAATPLLSVRCFHEDGKGHLMVKAIPEVRLKERGKSTREVTSTRVPYLVKVVAAKASKIKEHSGAEVRLKMLDNTATQITRDIYKDNDDTTLLSVNATAIMGLVNAINGTAPVDVSVINELQTRAEEVINKTARRDNRVQEEILNKSFWFVENYGEYGFRVVDIVPNPVATVRNLPNANTHAFTTNGASKFYRSLEDMQQRNPELYQRFYVQLMMTKSVIQSGGANVNRAVMYHSTGSKLTGTSMYDHSRYDYHREHLTLFPFGDFYNRDAGAAGWWYNTCSVARASYHLFEQVG